MQANGAPRALFRRLLFACGLGLLLSSCGRDASTGPAGTARYARAIAIQPKFPARYQQVASGSDLASFSRVRVVFVRESGATALDTLIAFPASADSLSLSFAIALAADAPDSGEPLSVLIYCLDSQGAMLFTGGPVRVLAVPRTASATNNTVVVPLTYSGAGASAVSVHISPKTLTVAPGDPFSFTTSALDQNGQQVPNAPVSLRIVDGSLATLGSTGAGRAGTATGSTLVIAELITGATDTATLNVTPAPVGGGATRLVFSTRPATAVAGAAIGPAIVVEARDALDHLQPSFHGSVTLSLGVNPGSATLGGTTTVAAVNGVATFADLALKKTAQGYRLVATSGTLLPDTTIAFAIVAAQPASLVRVGGSGQAAPVAATLTTPLSASVTDAFGNPVSLVTVQFAVGTGGGTLSSTAVPTDAQGIATTTWTLGSVTGAATVVASSSAIGGTTLTYSAMALPGGASRLVFVTQPSTAKAGAPVAPAIVLQVKDATGNPATSFNGAVSLALGSNAASATLGGTTSVTAIAGVATFTNVTLNRAGSGYTLLASASGLVGDASAPFLITSGAASAIAAVSGASQTGLVASVLPTPLSVKVTDAFGDPVAGVSVDWAVTSGGGSVAPSTTTTNAAGIATASWTLGAAAGAGTVSATASGLAGSPVSFGATSIASAATKLVIVSQPSNVVAGASISPAIVVQARDASNNLVTSFNGTVALSIGSNPGTATVGGGNTVTASGGVATFTGVTINKAGSGYTLSASAGGLAGDVSSAFNVSNGAAASLTIVSGNNQTGTALTGLASPLSVLVADANGNPVAGAMVTWSVAAGGGTLGANSSTTSAAGIATASWTLGAIAGAQSVTATAAGLAGSPATLSATALAGVATKLVITGQPGSVTAGLNLAPSIVVSAQDASGNIATSFSGVVSVALTTNPAAATLLGTTTVNAVAGIATFTNVSLTKAASGYRIGASSGALLQDNSAPFSISAAAAATIAAASGNNQTGGVQSPLAAPLTVLVTDAFANPVAGVSVNWTVAAGGGSLTTSASTTDASGIATNGWRLGSLLGSQLATATASGVATAPVTFDATAQAGSATTLSVTSLPATTAAGAPIGPTIVVTARDANGNIAAGFTGAVRLQLGSGGGGVNLTGTTTVNAVNGVATFGDVSITKAGGGYTLVASTNGGVQSVTTNSFSVVAGAPATITKTGGDNQPSILGTLLGVLLPNQLSVEVDDAYGNPVNGVTVHWAVTSGNATMSNPTSLTDASGTAYNNVRLGLLAGTVHVTVTVTGVATPVVFTEHGL